MCVCVCVFEIILNMCEKKEKKTKKYVKMSKKRLKLVKKLKIIVVQFEIFNDFRANSLMVSFSGFGHKINLLIQVRTAF